MSARTRRFKHARRRARHRYMLFEVDRSELNKLCKRIAAGEGVEIDRDGSRNTVEIDFRGRKVRVIYSRRQNEIVTFLPMEEA